MAAVLAALAVTAVAAQSGQSLGQKSGGQESTGQESPGTVVIQSVPPGVPVNPANPPLRLSDAQRDRIRQVLATRHSEVSFGLKTAKSAQSFEPKLNAMIPTALKGEAFPRPLIVEIPQTKRYTYLKFKGQVLIVDPMTRKIVDIFPETKG